MEDNVFELDPTIGSNENKNNDGNKDNSKSFPVKYVFIVIGAILLVWLLTRISKCGDSYIEDELLVDSLEAIYTPPIQSNESIKQPSVQQPVNTAPKPKQNFPQNAPRIDSKDTLWYQWDLSTGEVKKLLTIVSMRDNGEVITSNDEVEIVSNDVTKVYKKGKLWMIEIDGYKYYLHKPQKTKASRRVITYTVRRGDTKSGILKKFGMTNRELHELNPQYNLLYGSYIQAGQKLKVYSYE